MELLEKKEEDIIEKLEELYLQAAHNHDENIGSWKAENCLILDDDGELIITEETPSTTDGRVWNGDAIYVATILDFYFMENEDDDLWIRGELHEPERLQEFEEYVGDDCANLEKLKAFDKNAYGNIICDINCQIRDIDAPDWADRHFQMKVEEYRDAVRMSEVIDIQMEEAD